MVTEKIGYKISFTKPIRTTFEVEHNNKNMAIAFAMDMVKHRYPNKDWSMPIYKVEKYNYKEIVW